MPPKGIISTPRISLLGSFELEINGKALRLPTRKAEGLLAYLVLHRSVQSRERIASLFWGDSPDELARRSLRTALSALRKELGESFIITDRETIQLNPEFPIWVDVHEMEMQAKEILAGNQHASIDPDLYRSDLLRDVYDDWVLEEREHYRKLFINSLLQHIQTLKTNGEYTRAIPLAQKIISIDPANEYAYQHLIFCQHALGNRSEALKSYEEASRRLMEELGVEPSRDMVALYEQVRKSTDGESAFNFAKSNLPNPLTSFIGREHEIKTLTQIFETTRLLTLTGVGGCGKTRLSIQLAAQINDQFPDGVWWIELAAIQDENLLAATIKKTLGMSDSHGDSAEESLIKYLYTRRALLVMDNCEHIITACARLAENMLQQCPALKILTTSREALGIHGEIAWLVPSLSLPSADQTVDLMKFECPRLFLERATMYRPDLQFNESNAETILRICRALEGIPLAIELAAARVKTLSLEQLASRLDDKLNLLTTGSRAAQPRQQTLRATIDWSYELLSKEEQIVLQRLSVFYGTWSLEAAEFVCADDDIASNEILDLITRLLDKSLLVSENRAVEIRYHILEIVRQYALEKLDETGQTEQVRDRHAQYYSKLAQQVRPAWFTKQQSRLIKQFDADYPNLRVALAWGLENSQRSTNWKNGLRLAVALGPFWNFLAEYNEGKLWLTKATDEIDAVLLESDSRSQERSGLLSIKAQALYEFGFLVWFQSFYDQARLIFLECSEIHKELNDPTGLAYSNMFLAHSAWGLGDQDGARSLWAQSLEQFHKTDNSWGAGMVHSFRGRAEREVENYDQAEREYDQCLQLFGAVGDDWGLGISLSHQGMIAFQKNDPEKALDLFRQRLVISKKAGFRQSIGYSIFLMGMAAWKLNDPDSVQNNMLEALAYFYQIGNHATLAECLLGLAWVAEEAGRFDEAAYLLGVILKADETERIRMGFEDIYFHKPLVAWLQSKLEGGNHTEALAKGRTISLDQAAQEILGS